MRNFDLLNELLLYKRITVENYKKELLVINQRLQNEIKEVAQALADIEALEETLITKHIDLDSDLFIFDIFDIGKL